MHKSCFLGWRFLKSFLMTACLQLGELEYSCKLSVITDVQSCWVQSQGKVDELAMYDMLHQCLLPVSDLIGAVSGLPSFEY